MSMSYANMIENRHLKKTFITAITVSAILSCLTSAQSINEHIKLRREEKTRKKHDEEQDKSIRKLQKDVHGGAAGAKEGAKGIKDKVKDKVKGALPGKERKPEPSYEEDFDEQIERSARSIGREYDYGYRRGGDRFAEGDSTAQVRLQAQVIALQQSVIQMLQNAYSSGITPSQNDYAKLLQAAEHARIESIDALRGQSERLLEQSYVLQSPRPPSPPRVGFRKSAPATHPSLYCGYAHELQKRHDKPLAATFGPGGKQRCPACDNYFDVMHGRAWRITKDLPIAAGGKDRAGVLRFEPRVTQPNFKEFHILNRFIIKCHRDDGDFACYICTKTRPVDTIWSTMDDLVKHVQRAHDIDEIELDYDIREVS